MTAALEWAAARTYHHRDFPIERLLAARRESISVCLPAREEAATIGAVVEMLLDLSARGLVDQVVVVDAASADGTAEVAAGLGAEVHQEADLMPELGPVLGKGDAMWRSLDVLSGDIACFLDCDSPDTGDHFVRGLLGPLICEPGVEVVKACYRRPYTARGLTVADGGGRVTELMARPLLNRFYPELAGFRQPLAGEVAARRSVLERLPFATGYAVEMAFLLDAHAEIGLDAMAQVDLGLRHNRHQPLWELGGMALAILCAVAARLEREGRLSELAAPGTLASDSAPRYLAPTAEGLAERVLNLAERPPRASLPIA